jgi:hypothetical protein
MGVGFRVCCRPVGLKIKEGDVSHTASLCFRASYRA